MSNSVRVDLSRLSCLEQCRSLYNAYVKMLTGDQRVEVRQGENWVQYRSNAPGDMDRLAGLYMNLWQCCPDAQAVLPPLSRKFVGRGPAIGGRF